MSGSKYSLKERRSVPLLSHKEMGRLLSDVEVAKDGCWLWLRGSAKYGMFRVPNNGSYGTHQLSYRYFKGQITGEVVMHSCDAPRCINPGHLNVGTYSDNMLDWYNLRKGV